MYNIEVVTVILNYHTSRLNLTDILWVVYVYFRSLKICHFFQYFDNILISVATNGDKVLRMAF